MVCRMVYNGESIFSYLKKTLLKFKKKKQPAMQNNSVNKGIISFFGCQNLDTHAGIPV